jgi:hypothetical protein
VDPMRRAVLVLLVTAVAGCASRPDDGSTPELVVADLDLATYSSAVHPVLERRCGSIDCHGQLPRGLRVYGENGMRLPNTRGLTPGVGATTPEEARATYESIVGLEPEKTNQLASRTPRLLADAYDLTFLSKPLELERHRPGRSLAKGQPAEQCITSWLLGKVDRALCDAAMNASAPTP